MELCEWILEKCACDIPKDVIKEAFRQSCENGRLEIAKWFVKKCDLPQMEKKEIDLTLLVCCIHDHLDVVMWFVDTLKLSKYYFLHNNADATIHQIFKFCPLRMVQWFVEMFEITKVDIDAQVDQLAITCIWNLDVAKWLVDKYKISEEEVKRNNIVCKLAMYNAPLVDLQWFMNHFNITDMSQVEVILWTCLNNTNLENCEWIVNRFNITADKLQSISDDCVSSPGYFYNGSVYKSNEIEKWLQTTIAKIRDKEMTLANKQ
jgi:hypothetical protein